MSRIWQQFVHWFDSRQQRERQLILVVSLVVIGSLWLNLVSDPLSLKRSALDQQLTNLEKELSAVKSQNDAIIKRASIDPNISHKNRINVLEKTIVKLDEALKQKMRGFVDPSQMAKLLEDVLKQNKQLVLLRLQSLPAERIVLANNQQEGNEANAVLFRHGFELELQGSYLNTLSYVQALKDMEWDFYWDSIQIEIIRYPKAKIIMRLNTLSLKESWIGV